MVGGVTETARPSALGPRPGPKAGVWLSIQHLRAAAALMVVAHHALEQVGLGGPRTAFLQGGVDVFFAISGFIIWRTTATRPTSVGAFLRRRLMRIVPLYWLLTSVVLAVLLAAPRLLQTTRFDPAHVAASYLFVAWPNPAPGVGMRPLMVPGWTLNYELFFYGLFALALLAPRRQRAAAILVALAALTLLGLTFAGAASPGLRFYTSPLLLEFALGVLAAIAVERRRVPPPAACAALAACSVFVLAASGWAGGDLSRFIRLGLPAGALVFALAGLEARRGAPRWPAALMLGDASYAIYLAHPLVMSALAQAWRRLAPEGAPPELFVLVGVVCGALAGLAVHLWVERPIAARLQPARRRLAPGRALAEPAQ